jgi:hypothetical protein
MSVAMLFIIFLDYFSYALFFIDTFIYKLIIENPIILKKELCEKRYSSFPVIKDVEGVGDYTTNHWSDNETKLANVEQIGNSFIYFFWN